MKQIEIPKRYKQIFFIVIHNKKYLIDLLKNNNFIMEIVIY